MRVLRLLIVEDNRDLQTVLSEYLRETFGCEVVAANSLLQVRSATRLGPFDLALVDLLVDGTTVSELVREIRGGPANQEIPVILMSAFDPDVLARSTHSYLRRLAQEIAEIRPEGFLVKPFSLQALADTIARLTDGPWSAADCYAWNGTGESPHG